MQQAIDRLAELRQRAMLALGRYDATKVDINPWAGKWNAYLQIYDLASPAVQNLNAGLSTDVKGVTRKLNFLKGAVKELEKLAPEP